MTKKLEKPQIRTPHIQDYTNIYQKNVEGSVLRHIFVMYSISLFGITALFTTVCTKC